MQNNTSENDVIIKLVKLGKRNHLESIQQGKIRFTRLEKYWVIENKNIGDKYEGLESISYVDKNTQVFYSDPLIKNGTQIDYTNSIKSIANYPNNNYYVFCMSYFSNTDIINRTIFDKRIYEEKEWKDVLYFVDPRNFLEKICYKIKNYSPIIGSVKYYNYNESQHNLDVLSKSKDFDFQKEYRVAFISSNEEWSKAMRIALRAMLLCDGVSLLPDWRKSKGARIEARLARELGIGVRVCKKWE